LYVSLITIEQVLF